MNADSDPSPPPVPSGANNDDSAPPPTKAAPPPPPPQPQNLTGISQGGGIPPLPNSSNNSGRKARGGRKYNKSNQQRSAMPPPQFMSPPPVVHEVQQPQPQLPQQRRQMIERYILQCKMPLGSSKLVSEIMHYQWDRPRNNTIEFWREFVAKYYDSNAKERWCLSMCQDSSTAPVNRDGRPCNLCGLGPLTGYEVGYGGLAERFRAKFERMRGERVQTGMAGMHRVGEVGIWLYPNATYRTIYGLETIAYKGILRVAITDQRKVLAWEFCADEREVFVSLRRYPFPENLFGRGEILGRPGAKNASEENLRGNNNQMVMQIGQGQRINNNITMLNSDHYRITGQQIGGRVSGQRVPVGVNNNIRTAGFPAGSMETCVPRNGKVNLRTPCSDQEQQVMRQNMKAQGKHGGPSSHMMIGANDGVCIMNEAVGMDDDEDHDDDDDGGIERYLVDNPAGQFLTHEMLVMNHQRPPDHQP